MRGGAAAGTTVGPSPVKESAPISDELPGVGRTLLRAGTAYLALKLLVIVAIVLYMWWDVVRGPRTPAHVILTAIWSLFLLGSIVPRALVLIVRSKEAGQRLLPILTRTDVVLLGCFAASVVMWFVWAREDRAILFFSLLGLGLSAKRAFFYSLIGWAGARMRDGSERSTTAP